MLHLLGSSPAWRTGGVAQALPNTLPGWTVAFLAIQGDWVARERLAALLWPDAAPAEALHNLRMDLLRVRALLAEWGGEAALATERRRVRLLLPNDVAALRRTAADAGGPAPEYPGTLLASMGIEGFPALQEWAAIERLALATLWRDALLGRLQRGESAHELTLAQSLLDADPLDEAALLHLLRALRASGRDADADRRYEQYRQRLARELGVEPSPALRALASSAAVSVLPQAEAHAFVGRRLELSELARRLAVGARLVTLLGPGGAGKSRLARQALAQIRQPSSWIDLQDLGAIDSVAARIAQRLGVELRDGTDAPMQIARSLGAEPHVLVLDNAEHLPDLPTFVEQLLTAAPVLAVLVTSREPLAVDGESLMPLEGLALPDEDSRDVDAASAFDAVRLFGLRAQAARPDFELPHHIGAVIGIVETVGGLPLAIELAASWVRLLPPETIAQDLRRTLDILERDPATVGLPARPEHASVRAVLERSWALLAPRERDALEALAVFDGGFSRAAAAAVTGVALPLLSSLADRGLVRLDEQGRFGLHPLVAADAARRLAMQPAREAELRDRHAAFWATTLADVLAASPSDPRVIVGATQADYANACAAWAHALAARRHEDVRRLTAVWRVFFDTQGRYGEGARLLSAALDLPLVETAAERSVSAVRGALSMLLFRRQSLEHSLAVAEAGLALSERCGERRALVACLFSAGSVHSIQGHWQRSLPLFERALAVAREDHERAEIAVALLNVGICAKKDGRADDALAYYTQSLAIERELGRHAAAVRCLNNIGVLLMERNDWEGTREHMAEGLRLCRQYGIASLAPYLETGLGQALFELGRFEDAQRHLAHVHATVPAAELPVVHMNVTVNLGRVALRSGRLDEARPYFAAAARLALASETEADQLDFAMYWGEWLRDCGRPEDAARNWLGVIDHPLTEAGVRQGCEEGLATLKLDAAARAAARARAPTLETIKAEWAALPVTLD
jgi:DNA-binding SARP family transcriptional activator/tetratricopeptide (TPR) repeat protein